MNKEKFENILNKNNGLLKTADVLSEGISKPQFYQYVHDYDLEKVAHGVYVFRDALVDEFSLLQAQFPKAIFSHKASLYLHGLAEREPLPFTVTVQSSYNSAGLVDKGVKVYYSKKEWYEMGQAEIESPGGYTVMAYDMDRTICDIVRRADEMDVAVFNYAVRTYVARSDKDLSRLSRYASALRIERKIRERMGVLL